MTGIPIDPEGYSVNVESRVIHSRYSTHDGQHPRTRTAKGVASLLDSKKGTACQTCYPSPQYPTTPRPKKPQVRRKPNA